MSYVFYDTETTGTNTSFDQILQFAAIRTNDNLEELERFNIRCRLLPHIVPSPEALRVTRVTPAMLTDQNLPSHYEMIKTIHEKLHTWSPAVFVGFNSINFDEELLRQAFFQTLHQPYLTNMNGNSRSDVMRLAHATSIYAPEAITIPTNKNGKKVFKLGQLADKNNYRHHEAHEAVADVLATLYMARLIRDRAPNVWKTINQAATKKSVKERLHKQTIFALSEFRFGVGCSWLVTFCGQNPERDAQIAVFDLYFDPNDYLSLSVPDLEEVMKTSPKPIRTLAANKQPILMPEDAAPIDTKALTISPNERRRRMGIIRENPGFQKRVGQALALRFASEESSPHVEERIYDGFPQRGDETRMVKFHHVNWNERVEIASRIEDPRLNELAHRLIYFEHPAILEARTTAAISTWVTKRVLDENDNVPWRTVNKALHQTDELLKHASAEDTRLLKDVKKFIHSFTGLFGPF